MLVSWSSHSLSLACDLISSILCKIFFRISGGIIIGFNSWEAKALMYSNRDSVSVWRAYRDVYTLYFYSGNNVIGLFHIA